jgi:NAD+ synthase
MKQSSTPFSNFQPKPETDKIVQFIKQTFADNHKSTAVIGLSGGIDSAISATLTTKALDPENIHVLLLPSAQTDPIHITDALDVTKYLQLPPANIHQIDLSTVQQSMSDALFVAPNSQLLAPRLGNFTARLRMIAIFDFALSHDALVVGTENRSENLLGYFTRFGDAASDLEPISHLYKTEVRMLAKSLDLPEPIISKAPTAGLWAKQTDETELGFTYEAADQILFYYYDQAKTLEEITNLGFTKEIVDRVITHTKKVAFKHKVPYKVEI